MCISPITVVNPKHRLTLQGGTNFLMQVPCGKCCECQKVMSDSWFFRAYYQSKDCIDAGGYVYFDTVTYRNEDLPHISDYFPVLKGRISDCSCFNLEHYREFFKKLRVYIDRSGYGTKNLKYFMSSEYGTDERYTHRPHHHILFYVYPDAEGNVLPVELLSDLVAKAWIYGRTDGLPFKGMKYVLDHTFGTAYNSDPVYIQRICNYVSKYVMKDSEFDTTLRSRINVIAYQLFGKDKFDDLTFEQKDTINAVARNIRQFHRQSQGFGLSFLKYNDYDEMFETGMIKIPSTNANKPFRKIPIPRYFAEHLFYEKDSSNRNRRLNDEGVRFKMNRLAQNVFRFHDRIEDWLLTKANENSEDYMKFLKMNDERDLYEFAKYIVVYKGKIKSKKMRCQTNLYDPIDMKSYAVFNCGDEELMDEFVHGTFHDDESEGLVYNYSHPIYKRDFGSSKFVSDESLGNRVDGYDEDNEKLTDWLDDLPQFVDKHGYVPSYTAYDSDVTKLREFIEKNVISDRDDYRWYDYDEMYRLYLDSLKEIGEKKQNLFDWENHMKKILKKR